MLRFVGLRPKLYSIDYELEAHFECKDGIEKEVKKPTDTSEVRIVPENKVTAKGVKASVAEKLSFGDLVFYFDGPKALIVKHTFFFIRIPRLRFAEKLRIC